MTALAVNRTHEAHGVLQPMDDNYNNNVNDDKGLMDDRKVSWAPSAESAALQLPVEEGIITSMMLRNIPCGLTHERVRWHVDDQGFQGCYDWFCMPEGAARHLRSAGTRNLGYAFINFLCAEHAVRFQDQFHGFRFSGTRSLKTSTVSVSRIQGLQNNIRFMAAIQLQAAQQQSESGPDAMLRNIPRNSLTAGGLADKIKQAVPAAWRQQPRTTSQLKVNTSVEGGIRVGKVNPTSLHFSAAFTPEPCHWQSYSEKQGLDQAQRAMGRSSWDEAVHLVSSHALDNLSVRVEDDKLVFIL
ncbi:unnamed protein product [Polarella glacialis]|uniref:Mei2-like C-terminal RNA recognition motif domain-containing protein n=2 Tax=Polarella glacialis TaxID=89957 RepID=A0A813LNS8_POLGL|nr:unnamed protein product [Polarella glacialis]